MLDPESTCYTCLNMNSRVLINVFDRDNEDISYWDKLKFILDTELHQGEISGICESCVNLMGVTYTFVKMVKGSQETLRDLDVDDRDKFEPEVEITELDRSNEELNLLKIDENVKEEMYQINFMEDYDCNRKVDLSKNNAKIKKKLPQLHMMVDNVNEEKTDNYNCVSCKKSFKLETQLREHVLTHSSMVLYKCNYCSKSFCGFNYRQRHHKIHKEKGHLGKINEEVIDCDPPEEQIECKFCEEFSKTLADPKYKFMERIKLQCEKCNLKFKSNLQVMKHINTLHGESLYNCDFCDRSFKRLYLLQIHLHKNHECNLFYQKAKQTNFNKIDPCPPANMNEIAEKPFICPICGKGFPLRNTKKRHMRVHLGIKKYVCHVCLKKFGQSYQLKLHYKKHCSEKSFECSHCNVTFLSDALLEKHMFFHRDNNTNTPEFENINVDCDVFIENDEDDCHNFINSDSVDSNSN